MVFPLFYQHQAIPLPNMPKLGALDCHHRRTLEYKTATLVVPVAAARQVRTL